MPLPTPVRFEPIENFSARIATSLPSSLQPASTPVYYKAMVLRLLAGTLRIRCNKTGKEMEQRNNYSTLPFHENTRLTKRILVDAVRPKSLVGYDKLIKASLGTNRKFYTD